MSISDKEQPVLRKFVMTTDKSCPQLQNSLTCTNWVSKLWYCERCMNETFQIYFATSVRNSNCDLGEREVRHLDVGPTELAIWKGVGGRWHLLLPNFGCYRRNNALKCPCMAKVRTFWEADIIWKKSSSWFWRLLSESADLSKPWGRFFQILCVSQKVRTLHKSFF